MIKEAIAAIFILLSALTLSGCTLGGDTNEIAYIVLWGVDKGPGDKVLVTYQFESFKKDDGEKSEDAGKTENSETSNVITIEAENIIESLGYLSSIVSRTPKFAHAKAVVIGEEYARKGIADLLDIIESYAEFRSNIYILVVNDGTARDFIDKNNPPLESLPSKYITAHMYLSQYANYFLESGFQKFYDRTKSNSAAPYAALAGINSHSQNDGEKNLPSENQNSTKSDYYAGEIIRYGKSNPAEIMGAALFREDKMVGKLSGNETRIAAMLKQDLERWSFYIADPSSSLYKAGVEIEYKNKPKIDVLIQDGKPKIKVEMNFTAKIISMPGGANFQKRQIEELVSSQVLAETQKMLAKSQALGTDIIGFGYRARTQFKTYQEFMAFNWAEAYSNADIEVKVTTVVESWGLMKKPKLNI